MQYSVKEEQIYYSKPPARSGKLPIFPVTIEDCISKFAALEKNGQVSTTRIDDSTKNPKDRTIVLKTTREQSAVIRSIYNEIYKGNYPYLEMLDDDYLNRYLEHSDNLVCTYAAGSAENVGGCGTMTVDRERGIGYMRGLMMLPRFRELIDVKRCVSEHVGYGYRHYYKDINRWYTETRTAHGKAQYLMEMVGCQPCAILPNKDDFSGGKRRESDVLDVSYSSKALYELRDSEPLLLPELKPLYRLMRDRYGFSEAIYLKAEPFTEILREENEEIEGAPFHKMLFDNVLVESTLGKWNTKSVSIRGPNDSELKFMITDTVMSGEHAEIRYESYGDLGLLLSALKNVFITEELEYFECYVPADDVVTQRIFINQGFKVFGYLPAWKRDKDTGLLQDCIIFGYHNTPLNEKRLDLTPASQQLYMTLKSLEL